MFSEVHKNILLKSDSAWLNTIGFTYVYLSETEIEVQIKNKQTKYARPVLKFGR